MKTKTTKLIPLILAVLLLLTACTPGNSARGKELGYFNYPGLDWGMTEEEFLKAMGDKATQMEKEDYYLSASDENSEKIYAGFHYLWYDGEFLGKKAGLAFYFFGEVENVEPRLCEVQIKFEDEYDVGKLADEFASFIRGQDVETSLQEKMYVEKTDRDGKTESAFTNDVFSGENLAKIFAQYSATSVGVGKDLDPELMEKAKAGHLKRYLNGDLRPEAIDSLFENTYIERELSSLLCWYSVEYDGNEEKKDEWIHIWLSSSIGMLEFYAEYADLA